MTDKKDEIKRIIKDINDARPLSKGQPYKEGKQCPQIIIDRFAKLFELADNGVINRVYTDLTMTLSNSETDDFINKIIQTKEFKAWKSKLKIQEIQTDFI